MNNKWIKFILLYLGGVFVSLSQLKVVATMEQLSILLDIQISSLSWLMSVFTLSGIVLALPGGFIVSKIGPKKLLVIIMGCLSVGNLIGFLSNDFYILLISRAIEGISFSMIIMIGIIFINQWFKDQGVGLATGLWGTFSATGTLIAMNAFLPITQLYGLKSLWLMISIIAFVLMIIYHFYLDTMEIEKKDIKTGLFKEAIMNKRIVLLAFAQGCMAFVLFTYITIYPMIFHNLYGLSLSTANFYSSLFGLFGIPFGIIVGYLIDKTKKGSLITLLSFILMVLSVILTLYMNEMIYVIQIFLLSTAISLSSSAIMIIAPKSVEHHRLIGYSISLINLFYYIGIFIGAPITTKLIEQYSWYFAIMILAFVSVLGSIAIVFYMKINKERGI